MRAFSVPYGKEALTFHLPDEMHVDVIEPPEAAAAVDPLDAVEAALHAPLGGVRLSSFRGARSAAVAINDKTRPVPHDYLLPPLLHRLEALLPFQATHHRTQGIGQRPDVRPQRRVHLPLAADGLGRSLSPSICGSSTLFFHGSTSMVWTGWSANLSRGSPEEWTISSTRPGNIPHGAPDPAGSPRPCYPRFPVANSQFTRFQKASTYLGLAFR